MAFVQRWLSKEYYTLWWPRKYTGTQTNRARLQWFAQNERKNASEIEQLRWTALIRILARSGKYSPYYRDSFAKNQIYIAEIQDRQDFARIPLLQRSDLQENLDNLVVETADRRRLIRTGTGGSTGKPTPFYHDMEYDRQNAALIIRNLKWTGWSFGQPIVRVWGSTFDLKVQAKIKEKLTNYLRNITIYPAFAMGEKELVEWVHQIRRIRPYLLEGYAQALVALAETSRRWSIPLNDLGIQAVISSAEMLFPWQRTILEEVFGSPVFNRYGTRELSTIAHECRYGAMHINEDWVYVEIVDEQGRPVPEGTIGQVVITGFFNESMPFIRYATQDLAVLSPPGEPCPCGLHFRQLERIEGRVQDLIALPTGGVLSGVFFPHLFKDYEIRQFQVVQPVMDRLEVFLIPGEDFSDADLQKIKAKVSEYLPGISPEYHIVENIPAAASGKYRFTISQVSPYGMAVEEHG